MSQKSRILGHLKSGKTLTPLQAFYLFGCLSLSQRVGELRRERNPIIGVVIKLPTGKRVSCYGWAGKR